MVLADIVDRLFWEQAMRTNRRQFISHSALGGLGLVAAPLLPIRLAHAVDLRQATVEPPVIAWVSRCYRLSPADGARQEQLAWVQVDLGTIRPIQAIRLHLAEACMMVRPRPQVDFHIDCSNDPTFEEGRPLIPWYAEYQAMPANPLAHLPGALVNARFIRLKAGVKTSMSGATLPSGLAAMEISSAGTTISVEVRNWEASHRRGVIAGGAEMK